MHTVNRREFGRTVAAAVAVQGAQTKPRPAAPTTGSLTDVPGIKVGHFTDTRRPTGCTAILFDSPAAAGVDYNGSAPGESQVVLLQPVSPVERIHGLLLSGGGLLALPAAGGVLRYLEERKIGFDWGNPGLRIPIVVTAVIDDLSIGDPQIRPDADAAYKACAAALGVAGCGRERRRRRGRDGGQDASRPRAGRHEGRPRHREPQARRRRHCRACRGQRGR